MVFFSTALCKSSLPCRCRRSLLRSMVSPWLTQPVMEPKTLSLNVSQGGKSCQGTNGLASSGVSRALDLKLYLTSHLLIEIDIKSYQHSPEHGRASVPEVYIATMRQNLFLGSDLGLVPLVSVRCSRQSNFSECLKLKRTCVIHMEILDYNF